MPSPKVTAYAAAIIAAATWWLWGSGVFAWRDMLVLEHPTMVVGLDLPARNAPQDWVLGVAGQVLPATWVLRAYVLTGAILGAVGAIRLATGPLGQCATLTLTLLNPFVLERLLQGQWALAVAAWLAPAVWAFRHHTPTVLALVFLGSLTPSGAILLGIIALVARPRWPVLFGCLVLWLPWLIPSLLAMSNSTPTLVFHGRAETAAGTVGSFLGLGGIWNAAATFPSRQWGLSLVGAAITVALAPRMPRRLLVLAIAATLLFLLNGQVVGLCAQEHLPGAALLRDSHKIALLLIPGIVAAAGTLTKPVLQGLLLAASLLSIYDGPSALAPLRPIEPDPTWRAIPGTLLNLDSRGLETWNGRIIVDPWSKATATVGAGELVVDGTIIDHVSPRYAAGEQAWRAGDHSTLTALGIDHVRDGGHITTLTAQPQTPQPWWLLLLLPGTVLGAICSIKALKSRPVCSQENCAANDRAAAPNRPRS